MVASLPGIWMVAVFVVTVAIAVKLMVMVGITMLWVVAVNINWGFLPPTLDHLVLKQNAQSLSISNKP